MAVFGVPEVGAEDEAVLEVFGLGIGGSLCGITVEDSKEIDEFGPVVLKESAVGADGLAFGTQGDLLELVVSIPVEVEVAMEAADRLLGPVAAVEADAREEGCGDGAFDHLTFREFCGDVFIGVAEFQGVEGRALGGGFEGGFGSVFPGGFFFLGRVIGSKPGLVIGVKLIKGEGENTGTFAKGDGFSIVGNVGGFEGFIARGTFPISGGKGGEGEKEGGYQEEWAHLVSEKTEGEGGFLATNFQEIKS